MPLREAAQQWREVVLADEPRLELSQPVGDEVKCTTCYMCACRCGIRVHLKDGRIRYIEGNRDHPVNKGVLCAKGSAGIMQHYSPARLRKPLLRVGERGAGEFREIEWDEALASRPVAGADPRQRSAQARLLHRPRPEPGADRLVGAAVRHAATSPPMAASARSTWPPPACTRSAARSGSSASRIGSAPATSCCSASPRTTTATRSSWAWPGSRRAAPSSSRSIRSAPATRPSPTNGSVRPGTDGLLVLALIHELLRAGKVDVDYLVPLDQRRLAGHRRAGPGRRRAVRARRRRQAAGAGSRRPPRRASAAGNDVELTGRVDLPTAAGGPVFELLAERYLDPAYSPEAVADRMRRAGRDDRPDRRRDGPCRRSSEPVVVEQPGRTPSGRRHDRFVGRPVAMHAMRGISAHSNGFHTCRALHLLQILSAASMPRAAGVTRRPTPGRSRRHRARRASRCRWRRTRPLAGMPLGFPRGPRTSRRRRRHATSGSTRRCRGMRRWRSTACCRR